MHSLRLTVPLGICFSLTVTSVYFGKKKKFWENCSIVFDFFLSWDKEEKWRWWSVMEKERKIMAVHNKKHCDDWRNVAVMNANFTCENIQFHCCSCDVCSAVAHWQQANAQNTLLLLCFASWSFTNWFMFSTRTIFWVGQENKLGHFFCSVVSKQTTSNAFQTKICFSWNSNQNSWKWVTWTEEKQRRNGDFMNMRWQQTTHDSEKTTANQTIRFGHIV